MTTNTTYATIAQNLNAMSDDEFYYTSVVPENSRNVTDDDVEYYASEMRHTTRAVLEYFGVTFDETSITYRDIESLQNAYKLCNAISYYYETISDDEQNDELNPWTTLELGGDDDVDYNSSYIEILLDLVKPADMIVNAEFDRDFLNLVDSITTPM